MTQEQLQKANTIFSQILLLSAEVTQIEEVLNKPSVNLWYLSIGQDAQHSKHFKINKNNGLKVLRLLLEMKQKELNDLKTEFEEI